MHSTKLTVEDQNGTSLNETEDEFACSQLSDPEDGLWDLEFDAHSPVKTDRRVEYPVNSVSLPFRRKSQTTNEIACNIPNNTQQVSAHGSQMPAHVGVHPTRLQAWADIRNDMERMRAVERVTQSVLREICAKKGMEFVQYRAVQDESSDEEEDEDNFCFQFNIDTLPPYEIDLDELDQFLAQDIFVQELSP